MVTGNDFVATAIITGHEARGKAEIVRLENGALELRLKDYWIAPGAPDVHVYLTPDQGGDVRITGVVDFGRIRQLTGTISYRIPPNVNLKEMQKVVVYCKVYSVLFGDGQLDHTS